MKIVAKCWRSILLALEPTYGKLCEKCVMSVWKRLRDNYRRYFTQKNVASSGSAPIEIDEPKFFSKLRKLDKVFQLGK